MNRLEAIRERLRRYTSDATNTDEKLENGSISEWVMSSDGDMAWLLEQADDLKDTLWQVLYADVDNHIPNALHQRARAVLAEAEGE